ncbi:Putative gustatory receptor 28b [Anthophora quadrimaculata]
MPRKLQSLRYIYRTTLFFLFIFKFVGLATFTVKNQKNSKGKWVENAVQFTVTKIGILYNLLLSCLIIAMNYITVPSLYTMEYANKSSLTTLIEVFQGVIGSLVIFFISLHYCTNQSALVRIGNDLIETRTSLQRIQKPVDEKKVFRLFLVAHLLNFSLLFCVWITEEFAFHTAFILWLVDLVPTAFVSLLYIQYFSVLIWIDAAFLRINTTMQDFSKFGYDHTRLSILHHTRSTYISPLTMQLLVQIRNLHDHLCEVSGKVSQFYAAPVLTGVSFTFIAMLYNTYYLISPFLSTTKYMNSIILTNTVVWLLVLLYPLNLLTNKITSVISEVERTGGIVHTLLNRVFDREIKTELERFSLQLLHRRIKFTANGYINLDNTFLHSMLGTVAMYMVVLIQFDVGSPSLEIPACNCTQN